MHYSDLEEEFQFSLRELWETVNAEGSHTVPGRLRNSRGEYIDVSATNSPLVVEGSSFFLVIYSPGDPQQQLNGSPIEKERDIFLQVFENATEAIAIIDHEGRYLRQNRAHEQLLGYSTADLLNRTPAIHLGPQVFQHVATEMSQTGEYRNEHISKCKDGTRIRIELSAFAVQYSPDKPPLYVGIKRNLEQRDRERWEQVSQEKQLLEESLRQSQKMEMIGTLAAGVAHDFNNLLTPIMGFAELISHGSDQSQVRSEPPMKIKDSIVASAKQILEAAEKGRELTQRLLAFGRKQVLDRKPLDLRQLVSDLEMILKRVLNEQIEFRFNAPDELSWILADRNSIECLIMNLTANASAAMPVGGSLTIDLKDRVVQREDDLFPALGQSGRYIELQVSDTGVGIDRATLPRIFEPFFTTRMSENGSGLGLSIVHSIVEQHDGLILVHSEPQKGTRFQIFFPTISREQESDQHPRAVEGSSTVWSGKTVLVAEDEDQVRSLVCEILTGRGLNVLSAANGREGIIRATEHDGNIDLLLTDVVMPGCSGRELHEKLGKMYPDLKVLFISGYPRDEIAPDGVLPPGTSLLEKPFGAAALIDRVSELLVAAAN